MIGHFRMATSGGSGVVQPLPAGDGAWISHNGNAYDAAAVAAREGISTVTGCDSEVLGVLTVRHGLAAAYATLRCGPAAVLIGRPTGITAGGFGQPLWRIDRQEGYYYCSLPPTADAVRVIGVEERFYE
jgi:hypothetical protein